MFHLPRNIDIESLDDQPILIDNNSSTTPKSQTYPLYNHISNLIQKNNQILPLDDANNESNYYKKMISKTSSPKSYFGSDIRSTLKNTLLITDKATENNYTKNHHYKKIKRLDRSGITDSIDIGVDFDEFTENNSSKKIEKKLNDLQSENYIITDSVIGFTPLIKQSFDNTHNSNMRMKTPYSSNTNSNPFLAEGRNSFGFTNYMQQQNNNNDNYSSLFSIPVQTEYRSSVTERIAPIHDEMIFNKKGNSKRTAAFKLLKRKMSQK